MTLNTPQKSYPIFIANTFLKRLFGLMGKKEITYGLIFPRCNSIHTFFMKENIDVIGLDENNEVIYKYENLPKNKIIKINHSRKKTSILELPKKASQKIKIGTILIFRED